VLFRDILYSSTRGNTTGTSFIHGRIELQYHLLLEGSVQEQLRNSTSGSVCELHDRAAPVHAGIPFEIVAFARRDRSIRSAHLNRGASSNTDFVRCLFWDGHPLLHSWEYDGQRLSTVGIDAYQHHLLLEVVAKKLRQFTSARSGASRQWPHPVRHPDTFKPRPPNGVGGGSMAKLGAQMHVHMMSTWHLIESALVGDDDGSDVLSDRLRNTHLL